MCRSGGVYPSSSLESLDIIEVSDEESESEWPLGENDPDCRIYACGICHYPIVHEVHVEEIRGINIAIGLAFPVIRLFPGVFCSNENFLEQWRTRVHCPECGLTLTWIDEFVGPDTHYGFLEDVFLYHNFDEPHVILMPLLLSSGTISEIRRLYLGAREPDL